MSKAEEIAKAIYIHCFDDDFNYPGVLNALRICAEENAETIEQLQAKTEKMKCCGNCYRASHNTLDGTFCGFYGCYVTASAKCEHWGLDE